MTRLRLHPPRSVAILGLLAFTIGSQHCSIGAWRGDRAMACMAVPATAAATSTGGACCHAKHGTTPASKAPAGRSCCIHPAPVPTGTTLAASSAAAPVDLALAADRLEPETPAGTRSPAWIPADRPPPATPPALSHPGRAPPNADLV